jgi:hypothetical protein
MQVDPSLQVGQLALKAESVFPVAAARPTGRLVVDLKSGTGSMKILEIHHGLQIHLTDQTACIHGI